VVSPCIHGWSEGSPGVLVTDTSGELSYFSYSKMEKHKKKSLLFVRLLFRLISFIGSLPTRKSSLLLVCLLFRLISFISFLGILHFLGRRRSVHATRHPCPAVLWSRTSPMDCACWGDLWLSASGGSVPFGGSVPLGPFCSAGGSFCHWGRFSSALTI
jgi:hypothetical protein